MTSAGAAAEVPTPAVFAQGGGASRPGAGWVYVGKGAELPPPQINSIASPHRPLASYSSLEPPRREY